MKTILFAIPALAFIAWVAYDLFVSLLPQLHQLLTTGGVA